MKRQRSGSKSISDQTANSHSESATGIRQVKFVSLLEAHHQPKSEWQENGSCCTNSDVFLPFCHLSYVIVYYSIAYGWPGNSSKEPLSARLYTVYSPKPPCQHASVDFQPSNHPPVVAWPAVKIPLLAVWC